MTPDAVIIFFKAKFAPLSMELLNEGLLNKGLPGKKKALLFLHTSFALVSRL